MCYRSYIFLDILEKIISNFTDSYHLLRYLCISEYFGQSDGSTLFTTFSPATRFRCRSSVHLDGKSVETQQDKHETSTVCGSCVPLCCCPSSGIVSWSREEGTKSYRKGVKMITLI